jgi:hypothetical protein
VLKIFRILKKKKKKNNFFHCVYCFIHEKKKKRKKKNNNKIKKKKKKKKMASGPITKEIALINYLRENNRISDIEKNYLFHEISNLNRYTLDEKEFIKNILRKINFRDRVKDVFKKGNPKNESIDTLKRIQMMITILSPKISSDITTYDTIFNNVDLIRVRIYRIDGGESNIYMITEDLKNKIEKKSDHMYKLQRILSDLSTIVDNSIKRQTRH